MDQLKPLNPLTTNRTRLPGCTLDRVSIVLNLCTSAMAHIDGYIAMWGCLARHWFVSYAANLHYSFATPTPVSGLTAVFAYFELVSTTVGVSALLLGQYAKIGPIASSAEAWTRPLGLDSASS